MEIQKVDNVGKDGRRKIPTIRLIKSRKSWIWDQYLAENMDGQKYKKLQDNYKKLQEKYREFIVFLIFVVI